MQIGYFYSYPLPFTAIFASLCALLLIFLTFKVILLRLKSKTAIGDVKGEEFKRKNGALNNFTANTPLVIILFALAELGGMNCGVLFFIAGYYLLARITHAHSLYSFETETGSLRLRIFSMMSTFGVILALAGTNLYMAACYI